MNFAILFSCLLGLVLTFVFQEETKAIFIIFGQGHFLLAYLYMYKAKRISIKKVLLYVLVFSLLILLYFFVMGHSGLLFVTALYFIVHFVLDIFFLNGKQSLRGLLLTIPFFCIALSRVLVYIGQESASDLLLFSYPFTLIIVLVKWREMVFSQWLLVLLSVGVYISTQIGDRWAFQYFMSVIMISHYIMWYVYFLVTRDKAFIKPYLFNVIGLNTILVIGFYYYFFVNDSALFGIALFHEDAFYLWTLMHYVATARFTDLKQLITRHG